MNNKDKDLSKDLYALKINSDKLFHRKPFSTNRYKKVLSGEKKPYIYRKDIIENIADVSLDVFFEEDTFNGYISKAINKSDYTIPRLAEDISLKTETLYDILDNEILPWYISTESINELCLILNISKKKMSDLIQKTDINVNNIEDTLPHEYAARSQYGISSSNLKGSLMDANFKIAVDREQEKRDELINKLLNEPIE